jgi:hypothetical protein
MVDHWEICDVAARSSAAKRLSALLAKNVDTFPADARENAASLAQQMVAWPTDDAIVDRMQLLASCETVLLATDEIDTEPPSRIAVARRNDRSRPMEANTDVASLTRLPGGGLEIEPSQAPPLPRVEEPAEFTAPVDPREPRLLPSRDEEILPPAPLPIVDPAVRSAHGASAPAERKISNQPAKYQSDGVDKPNSANATQSANIAEANTPDAVPFDRPHTEREMSLIRLLQSDKRIADEAERQLREMGYGDVELHVATLVGSRDQHVRLRFVESLPRMAGVRSRRWLTMMLDDEDAAVRMAAIAQLATSGDATLVDWLARRAQLDPDPEVRRQGERLRGTRR